MTKNIVMLAGEDSGDKLGAALIRALKDRSDFELKFSGIGGKLMCAEGLKTIIPIYELSIIDYVEILINSLNIINRIKQTVDYIIKKQPDLLITIDSKGFNMRVVKKLRELNYKGKIIHYVAPTVWAYKPERAKKFAKYYDHLLAVLPNEPEYFIKEGLSTDYVGFPAIENRDKKYDKLAFKQKYNITNDRDIIALLPGSRKSEIKRLLPIIIKSAMKLKKDDSNLSFVIPVSSYFNDLVKVYLNKYNFNAAIINDEDRLDALNAAKFAITKSGTVTIELAILKIPMLVIYKVDPISAFLLKKVLITKYFNIINILLKAEIIPELMQENCHEIKIYNKAKEILNDEDKINEQIRHFDEILNMLGLNDELLPSQKAANVILQYL